MLGLASVVVFLVAALEVATASTWLWRAVALLVALACVPVWYVVFRPNFSRRGVRTNTQLQQAPPAVTRASSTDGN